LSYGRIVVEKCPQIITETESIAQPDRVNHRRKLFAEFDLRYLVRAKTPAGSEFQQPRQGGELSISVKVSGCTQNLPVRAFYPHMLTRL